MAVLSADFSCCRLGPIRVGGKTDAASEPNSTAPSVRLSFPGLSMNSSIARTRSSFWSLKSIDCESSTIASTFVFGWAAPLRCVALLPGTCGRGGGERGKSGAGHGQ